MTSVLLTIDTELSPAAHQRGVSAQDNFTRSILGQASNGERGIAYQAGHLKAHGLKGVFFVEALSASIFGLDQLKRTIEPVLSYGSEVQLHIHTEWLSWFERDPVSGRRGGNMADFSHDDQCRLLELGIENLMRAGAPRPIAFRAGNYGANNDTLRALATVGIKYDTSYNYPYLGAACKIATDAPLLDPHAVQGTIEVPVAVFEDYPNHQRPAQLCAVSSSEMRQLLKQSVTQGRRATVIVSHSFELLNHSRTMVNRIVERRFEQLCEMLQAMRGRAQTKGFSELDQLDLTTPAARTAPLRSNAWRTAWRMMEQAAGRVLYR